MSVSPSANLTSTTTTPSGLKLTPVGSSVGSSAAAAGSDCGGGGYQSTPPGTPGSTTSSSLLGNGGGGANNGTEATSRSSAAGTTGCSSGGSGGGSGGGDGKLGTTGSAGTDMKRKIAIKHHSYSMSSSNRSTTPTGEDCFENNRLDIFLLIFKM